jgi:hypothetical protein
MGGGAASTSFREAIELHQHDAAPILLLWYLFLRSILADYFYSLT